MNINEYDIQFRDCKNKRTNRKLSTLSLATKDSHCLAFLIKDNKKGI